MRPLRRPWFASPGSPVNPQGDLVTHLVFVGGRLAAAQVGLTTYPRPGTSSTRRGRIPLVPTMNIKDAAVHAAAAELARIRGVSLTEAVRQAVDEALRHDRNNDDDYVARGLRLAREIREASSEPLLTDSDLYDERGLPR